MRKKGFIAFSVLLASAVVLLPVCAYVATEANAAQARRMAQEIDPDDVWKSDNYLPQIDIPGEGNRANETYSGLDEEHPWLLQPVLNSLNTENDLKVKISNHNIDTMLLENVIKKEKNFIKEGYQKLELFTISNAKCTAQTVPAYVDLTSLANSDDSTVWANAIANERLYGDNVTNTNMKCTKITFAVNIKHPKQDKENVKTRYFTQIFFTLEQKTLRNAFAEYFCNDNFSQGKNDEGSTIGQWHKYTYNGTGLTHITCILTKELYNECVASSGPNYIGLGLVDGNGKSLVTIYQTPASSAFDDRINDKDIVIDLGELQNETYAEIQNIENNPTMMPNLQQVIFDTLYEKLGNTKKTLTDKDNFLKKLNFNQMNIAWLNDKLHFSVRDNCYFVKIFPDTNSNLYSADHEGDVVVKFQAQKEKLINNRNLVTSLGEFYEKPTVQQLLGRFISENSSLIDSGSNDESIVDYFGELSYQVQVEGLNGQTTTCYVSPIPEECQNIDEFNNAIQFIDKNSEFRNNDKEFSIYLTQLNGLKKWDLGTNKLKLTYRNVIRKPLDYAALNISDFINKEPTTPIGNTSIGKYDDWDRIISPSSFGINGAASSNKDVDLGSTVFFSSKMSFATPKTMYGQPTINSGHNIFKKLKHSHWEYDDSKQEWELVTKIENSRYFADDNCDEVKEFKKQLITKLIEMDDINKTALRPTYKIGGGDMADVKYFSGRNFGAFWDDIDIVIELTNNVLWESLNMIPGDYENFHTIVCNDNGKNIDSPVTQYIENGYAEYHPDYNSLTPSKPADYLSLQLGKKLNNGKNIPYFYNGLRFNPDEKRYSTVEDLNGDPIKFNAGPNFGMYNVYKIYFVPRGHWNVGVSSDEYINIYESNSKSDYSTYYCDPEFTDDSGQPINNDDFVGKYLTLNYVNTNSDYYFNVTDGDKVDGWNGSNVSLQIPLGDQFLNIHKFVRKALANGNANGVKSRLYYDELRKRSGNYNAATSGCDLNASILPTITQDGE